MELPPELKIVSHRGAKLERPENTLLAFDRALEYPIHGVELDIQWTKDGVPVIYHDPTLKKLGLPEQKISDFSWSEIQKLDCGSWFHEELRNVKIPSFEEVLERYNKTDTEWMIEIKVYEPGDYDEKRLLELAAMLQLEKQSEDFYILSFHKATLEFLQQKKPEWRYVHNVDLQKIKETEFEANQLYLEQAHAFCGDIRFLNQDWVDLFQELKGSVWTYTCNTPDAVHKAVDLDVDVMMTDNPKWLFSSR